MAPHRCAALGAAGSAGSGCGAREAKQRLRPSLQARSALRLPPSSAGCSSGSIASSSTSSTSGSCPSCSCCSSSCRRCRSPSGSTSSSTRMSSQSASHLGSCSALTRSCQGPRSNRSRRGQGALGSSAELAGQYEDSFADVEKVWPPLLASPCLLSLLQRSHGSNSGRRCRFKLPLMRKRRQEAGACRHGQLLQDRPELVGVASGCLGGAEGWEALSAQGYASHFLVYLVFPTTEAQPAASQGRGTLAAEAELLLWLPGPSLKRGG